MVDLAGWVAGLDALVGLIAGRFSRVEPRCRAGAYLRGLLAGVNSVYASSMAAATAKPTPTVPSTVC
jgi:hypothetical protein